MYSYLALNVLSIKKFIDIKVFYLDNIFAVFYDHSH